MCGRYCIRLVRQRVKANLLSSQLEHFDMTASLNQGNRGAYCNFLHIKHIPKASPPPARPLPAAHLPAPGPLVEKLPFENSSALN